MIKRCARNLIETSYEVADECKNATLFGIGNGYFGIRGSFEEFGDVYVQGSYVRGVFDRIVEIPLALSENSYMKRYYFDGEKLKEFEYEDSCINIGDFTALRLSVDGHALLPWTSRIKKWRRFIDYSDGSLVREVIYVDEKGNETSCLFRKTACFHANHFFIQSVDVRRLNHHLPLTLETGFDSLVKTNGQKKMVVVSSTQERVQSSFALSFGDKYRMEGRLAYRNECQGGHYVSSGVREGFFSDVFVADQDEIHLEKRVYFEATPDPDYGEKDLSEIFPDYATLSSLSKKDFRTNFSALDVKIENPEIDAYTRYANYQTFIGVDRFDSVHSLSAKNLTSEKYNQFVWWDCEIYQFPALLTSLPQAARSVLLYRLHRLDEAKKLAAAAGYAGAKFPFCSSVKGDENVWIYAKHPFLQIHINGDIAFALLEYYDATLDSSLLLQERGFEAVFAILDYFRSRASKIGDSYQLLNVTGTDEHHPGVNNDAYTNYEVAAVIDRALPLAERLGYPLDESKRQGYEDFRKHLDLPVPKNGVVPQFDGYFALRKNLPIEGEANPGFQMAKSGLYHLSQVIKQPDVLLLPTYLNLPLPGSYRKSWRLYENRCEASSSLTYPAHALAAIDNGDLAKFNSNFLLSLQMDFIDLYHGAYQGLHAGALAGGRYLIARGLAGFVPRESYLEAKPHFDPLFGSCAFLYRYQNALIRVQLGDKGMTLTSDHPVTVKVGSRCLKLAKGRSLTLKPSKLFQEEKQ